MGNDILHPRLCMFSQPLEDGNGRPLSCCRNDITLADHYSSWQEALSKARLQSSKNFYMAKNSYQCALNFFPPPNEASLASINAQQKENVNQGISLEGTDNAHSHARDRTDSSTNSSQGSTPLNDQSSEFWLHKAPQNDPRPLIYDELGTLYFSNGKLREALNSYVTGISLDASIPILHYHKGVVLQALGKCNAAVTSFLSTLHLDAKHSGALFNLGLLLQNDHPEKAIEYFQALLELEPDTIQVLTSIAFCHEKSGRLTEAVAYLNRAIELDPENYRAKCEIRRLCDVTGIAV